MNRKFLALCCALGISAMLPAAESLAHEGADQERFEMFLALFETTEIVGEPGIVPCTLSGGTRTNCISITTVAAPANHVTGPFCPRTVDDPPEQSGTWFKDGKVYDVDGDFIRKLAEFYDDDEWQMYDPETGRVTLASGALGCEVAGDPTSADRYKNYCVECELQHMGKEVTQTYVIPLQPAKMRRADRIGPHPGIGLALNGVKFDAPAPLHLILGGHTLGPFDDCVGHINPHSGYHYHGVAGCGPEVDAADEGHAAIIGVSMDGFTIHNQHDLDGSEPLSLDRCRGHESKGLGYHYHASGPGDNQIIGCFSGETGCSLKDANTVCDASAQPERGPRPPRP